MIRPEEVKRYSKKKEKANLRFRRYLKVRADPDILDQQFLNLHNELFKDYDCSQCRNCCKEYQGSIPKEDLDGCAKHLNMTKEAFMKRYLKDDLLTIHKPCDFLVDNECILGECKPENCKKYPYTNQPDRLFSLYSVLEAVSICPVAYEIYERLKKEYHFNG